MTSRCLGWRVLPLWKQTQSVRSVIRRWLCGSRSTNLASSNAPTSGPWARPPAASGCRSGCTTCSLTAGILLGRPDNPQPCRRTWPNRPSALSAINSPTKPARGASRRPSARLMMHRPSKDWPHSLAGLSRRDGQRRSKWADAPTSRPARRQGVPQADRQTRRGPRPCRTRAKYLRRGEVGRLPDRRSQSAPHQQRGNAQVPEQGQGSIHPEATEHSREATEYGRGPGAGPGAESLRPPQVVPKMPCEQDLFFAPCRRESVEIPGSAPPPDRSAPAAGEAVDPVLDVPDRGRPGLDGVGHLEDRPIVCLDNLTVYLRFPREHWNRIRHSNFIERTFGETRRRVKVIGRLPGEHSCTSLVWAVLDRASRGWRGFTMTPAGLRLLPDLRRALFYPPTPLAGAGDPATETGAELTRSA